MPTPVAAARQCLTQDSVAALDDAVAVARRRGHAQTTSLHMVSSLLSLPTSSLREACSRTRNSAYSTRVQFKALELSLSVSLDRLPSSQGGKVDEPPVSNSLMAAIKRSQANQRRQPENFSFYQQQQQQYSSCSSVPLVKVELQNLIVSILDDPLVSRVFGEAGFRSCDIKMATIRPGNGFHPSQLFGYTSRYKRPSPPLFLCNLTENCGDVGGKGFNFPFMGCFSGDENSRRIGEVMLRDKKKCPLLLGISAHDSLRNFLETVHKKISGVLPDGLTGLHVACLKDEILRYLNGDCDEGPLKSRFEEVERAIDTGVVVNFGDLGALVGEGVSIDRLRFLVGNLARLVEAYGGKLWLIGAATTYEVYFKILNRFPSIEEDWQVGVLPITSIKFSMGGSYPRSSLMESFVPLGGFFSMPSEAKTPSSQYVARCHLCNEKYEQELEKHQSNSSSIKETDDRVLKKKWDSICQQHHFGRSYTQIPRILGFQVGGKPTNDASNESSNEQGNKNASSSLSTHLQKSSSMKELSVNLSKSGEIPLDDRQSPASVTSVTTDLGLGIISAREPENSVSNCSSQMHSDVKDPKLLYRALIKRVGHQEEALSSIVETLTRGSSRRNVWINLRGGDGLSKKKLGLALAEIVYKSRESLIYVDLSFEEEMTQTDALFISQIINKYDITMRSTVVDYMAENLIKKPRVVFLDNVDKADLVVQNALLQAVKSGRFTDLCGREVNVGNCIFLGATGEEEEEETDVLTATGSSIQIAIRFDLSDDPTTENSINKRKLVGQSKATKRPHKASNSCLDLNLPAEVSEICNAISLDSDSDSTSENSSSWMDDFDARVDQTVAFKQYDFSSLSEKMFKSMSECLHDAVGSECSVEVEAKAMQQILAAAYLYGERFVEDWIRHILREGFVEAMGKYSLGARSIVRLVASTEGVGENQTQGLLPGRVTMK